MVPITTRSHALDTPIARRLIAALDAELQARYPEAPLEIHLAADEVTEARGTLLVAYQADTPVGCGAVRMLDTDTAELKRMYVVPAHRGRGIGAALLTALEREAQVRGASHLQLETGVRQPEAVALYRRAGYTGVPPFGDYVGPPISVYLGKALGDRAVPAVSLLEITPELAEDLHDAAGFERRHRVRVGADLALIRDVVVQERGYRVRLGGAPGLGGYLAVDHTRQVAGTCAFKGRPADGAVEIAYFTFPAHQRRGHATAMAGALIGVAARSGEVDRVRAHTLPEPGASARLLRRLRFEFVGLVDDPDDGPVWRWERPLVR